MASVVPQPDAGVGEPGLRRHGLHVDQWIVGLTGRVLLHSSVPMLCVGPMGSVIIVGSVTGVPTGRGCACVPASMRTVIAMAHVGHGQERSRRSEERRVA